MGVRRACGENEYMRNRQEEDAVGETKLCFSLKIGKPCRFVCLVNATDIFLIPCGQNVEGYVLLHYTCVLSQLTAVHVQNKQPYTFCKIQSIRGDIYQGPPALHFDFCSFQCWG